MKFRDVIRELEKLSDPKDLQQMKHFGINASKAYGVSIAKLRKLQKKIKVNHELAKQLWFSEIHEARLLGSMVADPARLTEADVDRLVFSFDSWDVVDEFCLNLFRRSGLGYGICFRYVNEKAEFVKRTSFAMMATFAWYHESISDRKLEKFFPYIIRASTDERNFVKKAVNWALRQIGKRNKNLNKQAIAASNKILKNESPAAQWVGKNALKELASDKVKKRLA